MLSFIRRATAAAAVATVATAPLAAHAGDFSVRVMGKDRYHTAALLSDGTEGGEVFIASGETYADALAASAVAGAKDAAVLLVKKDAVPEVTEITLKALAPSRVTIVGGTAAVSQDVQSQISTWVARDSVHRVAGADRYETAAKVAALAPNTEKLAFVASGEVFPDALSASWVAGQIGAPVLTTKQGTLPASTRSALKAAGVTQVFVVGGDRAVSSTVTDAIEQIPGIEATERVSGKDRYETSAMMGVLATALTDIDTTTTAFASGENFPDALAGGAFAARQDMPMLLVKKDSVPNSVADLITSYYETREALIIGGTAAVSATTESQLVQLISSSMR